MELKEVRSKINIRINTLVNQYYIQSRTLNTKEYREKAGQHYLIAKKFQNIVNEAFDELEDTPPTLSE